MLNLKKFFGVILLVALMILPQVVSAEKTDYVDKSYNFRNVGVVVILGLQSDNDLRDVSTAARMKVFDEYDKNSRKLKCKVLTEDMARQRLGMPNASRESLKQRLSDIADMWVECDIKLWESSYHIVPARTVWEDKKRTRRIRNRWGDWEEETYYETVPVTYPPYRVDTSDIIANFEAHDAATGKIVFVREDNRSRDDQDAQKDMFGRMCNSFFEDLAKKIK